MTAPSGGFPCGFNIVGRLEPLHEVGKVVGLHGAPGLLSSGFGPKKPWYPQMWGLFTLYDCRFL